MNDAWKWWQHPEDSNSKLWRYMDLSKFVALLQSKSIAFARADLLGDKFEGSVGALNALEAETLIAMRASFPEDNHWKGRTDEQIREQFVQISLARKRLISTMFISCWHMNEHESAAMWKLYSKSADAICIQTRYAKLIAELPEWIESTEVQYKDFDLLYIPSDNAYRPFSFKRASFAHEREIRFLAWDLADPARHGGGGSIPVEKQPTILEFGVDLSKVVENIFVSPEASEWFTRVVQGLVESYGLNLKVANSGLNANPLY